MPREQQPNSGALFKNEKKTNPKQPDYTGTCDVMGTEYRISAWIKEGKKNGKKYMSLSFSLPGEYSRGGGGSAQEEDIPF